MTRTGLGRTTRRGRTSQTAPVSEWLVSESTEDSDVDEINRLLREHNWRVNAPFMQQLDDPAHASQSVHLVARRDSAVIGGLIAETQFGWLKVGILAVAPRERRRGVGRSLLEKAELIAAKRGCSRAYVDSMAYQGPDLYRACGYVESGRLDDWDGHGNAKFFFTKRIGPATPTVVDASR